jgi:hypothetical protein
MLERKIKELIPTAGQQKLLNVCRTRWVARINGLTIFQECYIAIISALQEISLDKSYEQDVRYQATGMKTTIENFGFVVSLVVVTSCLQCTKPLTLQLQSTSLDAGKAREKVSLLYLMLNELQSEIDNTHANFHEKAVDLANQAQVLPSKPRTTGRQMHRDNIPATSTSNYYKKSVTMPFLSAIVDKIRSQFSEGNLDALDLMYVMPSTVVSNSDWKETFSHFLKKYEDDLPDVSFLESELRMWQLMCYNQEAATSSSFNEVIPLADKFSFLNILTALRIFGTIPVTTCSCERSISTLRRLKTFLGEKRLKSTSPF